MDLYRKKIIAANWKMNTDPEEGSHLLQEIQTGLPEEIPCSVVIAPPYTHLVHLKQHIRHPSISLGAQNCHYEKAGAFTGEISLDMLKSIGVEYVIVGHSERRQLFHESNEIVKLKLDAILNSGLQPIFCCGEPADIRESETHNIFVRMQLEEGLFHLDRSVFPKVIIAYEPIWAIGTGVTATPQQAQEMHMYIREQIALHYDKIIGEETRILYGGSIKSDNAQDLFAQDDIDGGLVGGSSLNASTFRDIIAAAC